MSAGSRPPRRTATERRAERAAVEDPAIVMSAAARLLEGRARSVVEIRRRLGAAGYRPDLVAAVVDRLVDLGLLDDEAFARAWVASRDRARPRGERALRDELRVKGVAPDVVASILAERALDPDEAPAAGATVFAEPGTTARGGGSEAAVRRGDAGAAERLLARNERALLRQPDPRRRRQRAWAVLARAGFDAETAREAVAAAERRWSLEPGDDAPDT